MSARPPSAASRLSGVDWRAVDGTQWNYRLYLRIVDLLASYHRTSVQGPPPPDGRCIFVTHHGAGYLNLDLVIAGYELAWRGFYRRGEPRRLLRVVASQSQIERALPGLPRLKEHFGLIDPGEDSCLAVLERGEQLLVTPGGRREAQPGPSFYRLRWEERFGFARLALRTGSPIVPLAVVGGAQAYPGFAFKRLSLWSPIPLPSRLDIALGEPIAVERAPERAADAAVVGPLQQLAWQRTQALYDGLLAHRGDGRGG